ncbi:MAG: hypothetical protein ACXWQ6_10685 [Candidatus Limnocylindrales bacterium]
MPSQSGGETGRPAVRSHDLLLSLLILALLARGALSFVDAWSLYSSGVRFIPISDGATVGGAPFWSLLWGVVAFAAALLMLRRYALGWLLAAGACVAYLLSGIGDAALFQVDRSVSPVAWVLFLVDLAAPAIVLALLFSVRPWFFSVARRSRLHLGALAGATHRRS